MVTATPGIIRSGGDPPGLRRRSPALLLHCLVGNPRASPKRLLAIGRSIPFYESVPPAPTQSARAMACTSFTVPAPPSTVPQQPGCVARRHYGGDPVLRRDDGRVRQDAAGVRHECAQAGEKHRPDGRGDGADQDIAGLDLGELILIPYYPHRASVGAGCGGNAFQCRCISLPLPTLFGRKCPLNSPHNSFVHKACPRRQHLK